ncbi:regulator of nonsense transcripts 1 [Tritrichomonas foetus]|uniref:Regulator of nonsense transcripts 1 n=1 Tax=Tritrichomonas foetus TaxID=1144522 RepID=A0A1J4JFG4_9EUKA|nr:regulator of nonsense transcripts 1 [Tritrichomonas foetus]|eukprot:OHS96197.1 regulator of nonsense transcripts 1 [Tritrichomonas foetus]
MRKKGFFSNIIDSSSFKLIRQIFIEKVTRRSLSKSRMENTGPHCAYCNCSEIDCLVQCASTHLYFCNGKGVTNKSHIIHHLQSIQCDSIILPPQNKFSQVKLECYICESTNIFRLGFLKAENGAIYVVCSSPCQFDDTLRAQHVDNSTFQPLVVNSEFYNQVVRIPNPDEYTKVPISRTIYVRDQALQYLNNIGNIPNTQQFHLNRAKLKYDSVDDFVDIMKDFCEAEHSEITQQEQNRRYGGMTFNWESSNTVTFKSHPQLFKMTTLGCSILLVSEQTNERAVVVKRSNNMNITARLNNTESSLYNQHAGITISVVVSDVPYKRQNAALESIRDPRPPLHWLILDLFMGNTEKLAHHNRVKRQKLQLIAPSVHNFPSLNKYQICAIKVALSQRFTLIQGPPGTGKTTVIAALAHSFVRNGVKPVLVCAQSNVAADFATARIAQVGLNVVRVLSAAREAIVSDVDEFTTRRKAAEKFGQQFESLIDSTNPDARWQAVDMERRVVYESDVVCATCVSAGGARLKDVNFKAVIFDESGQCLDPDLLIALTHNAQQAVLVGDHRQLGPVVVSRAAALGRFDIPLMQRLVLLGVHPVVLRKQYRMHSAISSFPSAMFYKNLLKDGLNDETERKWPGGNVIPWPNHEKPIMFWNVFSTESNYESASSYVNQAEVGCIAKIITRMAKNGVSASDIGIITPYAGQQSFLVESLPMLAEVDDPDSFFDELEISSVDAFQGREKNFIIFSCVRANTNYDIGFLKDMHRLCVSLTRAKYGIITVGNASTFAKNSCWCKFIMHYIEAGAFIEGDDLDTLKPSTFSPLVQLNEDNEDDLNDDIDEDMYNFIA